jgi:hypothetical protein
MVNGRRTRQPTWTAFQPGVPCHPVEIRRQSRNGGELEIAVACAESRRCLKREERATWLAKIKVKGSGQECPLYRTLGVVLSLERYTQLAGGGARPTQPEVGGCYAIRFDLYAYTTARSGGASRNPQNGITNPRTRGARIDAHIGTRATRRMM